MFDRCILHIGTEKTGTTSVQGFLRANRRALAAAGVYVPRRMGRAEHIGLVQAVVAPHKRFGPLKHRTLTDARILQRQQKLRLRIQAELSAAARKGYHTLLISSERLSAQVRSADEGAALQALLSPFVRRVEIWVYLRPQAEFATSFYSTDLRNGVARLAVLPNPSHASTRRRYDYAAMLDFWQAVFPAATLHPQIFARSELQGGDVVADFMGKLGIDHHAMPAAPPENPSLTAAAQLYLQAVNAVLAADPARAAQIDRERITRRLSRDFAGTGRRPARARATVFQDAFAAGNAQICERYFPGRTTLFAQDFSRFPVQADPDTLTDDAYHQITTALSAPGHLGGRDLQTAIAADRGLRPGLRTRLLRWLRARFA